MSRVIGITGRAQHGKDTLGATFVAAGFTRYGFADALKSMALTLNPIIREYTFPKHPQRLQGYVNNLGWEGAKKDPEVRRFLQVLGTEGVRDHLGPNSWVKALELRWLTANCPDIVVTDVRFPNEAEWIRRVGGRIVTVVRPNFDNGVDITHPSESQVSTLPFDFSLVNEGTLEEYRATAAEFVKNYPSNLAFLYPAEDRYAPAGPFVDGEV